MIDTLKASQELVKNGFSAKQAQSIVNVVANRDEQLATKSDIRVPQDKMKTLQWMVGLSLTFNIAVLLALIFR